MANIVNYLKNILEARFGRDVRQSIHDGIEAINNEVVNYNDYVTEKANEVAENIATAVDAKQAAEAASNTATGAAQVATDASTSASNAQECYDKSKEIYDNFQVAGGVAGVKGEAEETYRTGMVEITAENVGAARATAFEEHTADTITHITAEERTNWNDAAAHTNNENNPHGVTAEQIGLGNVDNTSDKDKNVKYAESAESATKDGNGKDIDKTYLPLTGGTVNGTTDINGIKTVAFSVKSGTNYLLLYDVTDIYTSDGTTTDFAKRGFVGFAYAQRNSGVLDENTAEINIAMAYQKDLDYEKNTVLKTNNPTSYIPCIVYDNTDKKYYLSLKIMGLLRDVRLQGMFYGDYIGTAVTDTTRYTVEYDKYTLLSAPNADMVGNVKVYRNLSDISTNLDWSTVTTSQIYGAMPDNSMAILGFDSAPNILAEIGISTNNGALVYLIKNANYRGMGFISFYYNNMTFRAYVRGANTLVWEKIPNGSQTPTGGGIELRIVNGELQYRYDTAVWGVDE